MRPRFTLRWLIVAVGRRRPAASRPSATTIGRRGYALFLAACLAFAVSAAVASKKTGAARAVALAFATLSCAAGLSAFLIFGRR